MAISKFITADDIRQAPMLDDHRETALLHLARVEHNFHESYSNLEKQIAWHRLARMMLVLVRSRDYHGKAVKVGHLEPNEPVYSMLQDFIDAATYFPQFVHSRPRFFASAEARSRERTIEIRRLLQDFETQDVEIAIQLWDMCHPASSTQSSLKPARTIDLTKVLRHSKSESNILWHNREFPLAQDRKECKEKLLSTELEHLSITWPPPVNSAQSVIAQPYEEKLLSSQGDETAKVDNRHAEDVRAPSCAREASAELEDARTVPVC